MAQMPPKDPNNPGPTIIAPPAPVGGGGGGWKTWIPAIVGAATDLFIGHRQQKNVDTAHQREVKDLQAAGLNPILSAMGGRGAAAPDLPSFGEDVQKGVGSALALQMMKAQLENVRAQTDRENSTSFVNRVNAMATQTAFPALQEKRLADVDLAKMNVQQLRDRFPVVMEQLRAEVMATTASAARSEALAAIDRARLTGEVNLQKLQKDLGESSPALNEALTILRLLNEARK